MITALTWLSSAESKVADLDSIVEASQTEEQIDMEDLQKELAVSLMEIADTLLQIVWKSLTMFTGIFKFQILR